MLLQAFQRLGLQEANHQFWVGTKEQTYVFGDGAPINRVFHTPDLEIMALMQLSFQEGVGNHQYQTVLVDVSTRSAIRKFKRRVVPPPSKMPDY